VKGDSGQAVAMPSDDALDRVDARQADRDGLPLPNIADLELGSALGYVDQHARLRISVQVDHSVARQHSPRRAPAVISRAAAAEGSLSGGAEAERHLLNVNEIAYGAGKK
jgi:hypothetical protein